MQKQILKGLLITALSVIVGTVVFAAQLTQQAQETDITNTKALFGDSYKETGFVSKKLFSKALADYSRIAAASTKNCYKDLKSTDKTSPYICALKNQKILTGAKTSNFKPENKVTWSFAITSLCRAQKWTTKINYNNCKKIADANNLLTSPLPSKIQSSKKITFKDLAYLMTRANTDISKNVRSNADEAAAQNSENQTSETAALTTKIPDEIIPSVAITPFPDRSIATNFFENIWLDAPLPNRFAHNEVYFVEGELENAPADTKEVFVFLCDDGQSCDDSTNFLSEVNANGRFKIPVYFKAGNYQIGIIAGRSGQSRIANVSVLPRLSDLPESIPSTTGAVSTGLSASYKEGETIFKWDTALPFTRLTIFQKTNRVDYIFRQNIKSFSVPSEDFEDFNQGNVGWIIEQANSKSPTQQLKLTQKDFRKILPEKIQINSLTETFTTPSHFTFGAKALIKLSKTAAITQPDGKVKEVKISESDIPANRIFTVETDFTTNGTYIFEINDTEGGAVVNVPIYVGNKLPLVPDYFALNQTEPTTTPLGDTSAARARMLNLINIDRAAHALQPVTLSSELNNVAQAHTQNMATQNFFAHVDPSGKNPDDRRKAASYPAPIRENLGKASTLELVEAGLMRSPVHRSAIIDPNMKRIGIGIVKNSKGYYIVTQNFSSTPITAADLDGIENELFNEANLNRQAAGLGNLVHDPVLKGLSREWSANMVDESSFGTTNRRGTSLLSTVRDRGYNSSIQGYIVEAGTKDQLKTELLQEDSVRSSANTKIGIGIAINNVGELYMTIILTQ